MHFIVNYLWFLEKLQHRALFCSLQIRCTFYCGKYDRISFMLSSLVEDGLGLSSSFLSLFNFMYFKIVSYFTAFCCIVLLAFTLLRTVVLSDFFSCIEKWLKGTVGKCPQCNAKAVKKDIRVLFAKALKASL